MTPPFYLVWSKRYISFGLFFHLPFLPSPYAVSITSSCANFFLVLCSDSTGLALCSPFPSLADATAAAEAWVRANVTL